MIALTIDCEQWTPLSREGIPQYNNVLFSKEGNEKLLKIFKKLDIRATFFVTGFFAERFPKQIQKIYSQGHEIASHGYNHCYRNGKIDFEEDIKKSKNILEGIIGSKIYGFRAPQAQYSLKLLKVLNELNFKYDSSLHPAFVPGFYNNIKYPIRPFSPQGVSIKEIPIGVMPYLRLPIGWLWMRNFGAWWTGIGAKLLLRKKIVPVLYFHSWEFANIGSKYLPFYYLRNTGDKFCDILGNFLEKHKNQEFITLDGI